MWNVFPRGLYCQGGLLEAEWRRRWLGSAEIGPPSSVTTKGYERVYEHVRPGGR